MNGTHAKTTGTRLENGTELRFSGRLFAATERYENGALLRRELYAEDTGGHVYTLTNGSTRRAYRVSLHGEACTLDDGETSLTVPLDMLMLAIRELSGLDALTDRAELEQIEETLRSAHS